MSSPRSGTPYTCRRLHSAQLCYCKNLINKQILCAAFAGPRILRFTQSSKVRTYSTPPPAVHTHYIHTHTRPQHNTSETRTSPEQHASSTKEERLNSSTNQTRKKTKIHRGKVPLYPTHLHGRQHLQSTILSPPTSLIINLPSQPLIVIFVCFHRCTEQYEPNNNTTRRSSSHTLRSSHTKYRRTKKTAHGLMGANQASAASN